MWLGTVWRLKSQIGSTVPSSLILAPYPYLRLHFGTILQISVSNFISRLKFAVRSQNEASHMNTRQEQELKGPYSLFDSSISIQSLASCGESTLRYYFQKKILNQAETPQNDFSENNFMVYANFYYLNLFLMKKKIDVKGLKMELERFLLISRIYWTLVGYIFNKSFSLNINTYCTVIRFKF